MSNKAPAPDKKTAKKNTKNAAAKKMTYEQKKELKLEAQRKKNAAKTAEPANKDRFYCTNKDMLAEMVKWRDSNKAEEDAEYKKWKALPKAVRDSNPYKIDYTKRTISEELGRMMMQIAWKVLNRSEFRNYTKELKEDMASFGYYKIIRGLKNFDFRFTNCFSFFTTAFYNAYLTTLKGHYKHINLRKYITVKLLSEMETYPGINASASLAKVIKQYLDDDGQPDDA